MFQQSPIMLRRSKAHLKEGLIDFLKFNQPQTIVRTKECHYEIPNASARVSYNGTIYTPQQFHFHRHSEHLIDDKKYDMEGHLVNFSDKGNILVVGVMFNGSLEEQSSEMNNVFSFPVESSIEFCLTHLLPSNMSHYTYVGSLTTAPFTGNVQWCVMNHPINIHPTIVEQTCLMSARHLQEVQSDISFIGKE